MTIYCLTLAPLPRSRADAAAALIENAADLKPLALALTDCGHGRWEVEAQYSSSDAANRAVSALRVLVCEHAIAVSALPDIDWVKRSLEGLGPVTAGRFFVHGSHHRSLGHHRSTAIEIDAATAFGTGHHPTTRGCLLALDRILKRRRPRCALDIGCGTGVLAIAFARATRRPALACDIDPEAMRVTIDNARRNGVGGLMRTVLSRGAAHGAIADEAPFDLVFANILARPLAALAPGIANLTDAGGTVVLSGLYGGQERGIESVYRLAGLDLSFRLCLEGWCTLVLMQGKGH